MPIFWGYVLVPMLSTTVSNMIESGRLALVFDLDETLLVANSASSLDNRLEQCRKLRCVGLHQPPRCLSPASMISHQPG